MNHYQEQFTCSVCRRELVADIQSIGSGHQTIMAITCKECGIKVGGKIMKQGEVEEIKFEMGETKTW